MTDRDVRDALWQATEHLEAAPDLLDRVRAGGRRRVVRRRALLGAGLATLVAGGGAATWTANRPVPAVTDGPGRATRGDLAHDEAFKAEARAAWATWQDPPGSAAATVVWAGTTPAGRVAVLLERLPDGTGITGFVADSVNGLIKFGRESLTPGVRPSAGLLLNDNREYARGVDVFDDYTTVLVVDGGAPVEFSHDYRYDDGGRVVRAFEPVRFTDGAAVVKIAPLGRYPRIGMRSASVRPRLSGDLGLRENPPGKASIGAEKPWDLWLLPEYLDPFGYQRQAAATAWLITGRTPAGRTYCVQTLVLGEEIRTFRGIDGGPPEYVGLTSTKSSPAGVRLRLPAGLGVVVGIEAEKLEYRSGGGAWLPTTTDGALLPDAATEIRVTREGRTAVERLPA